MSTIWTPSGEYVPKPEPGQEPPRAAPPPPGPGQPPGPGREPTPEEMEAMAAELMAAIHRPVEDHILDMVEQLINVATLHLNREAITGGQEKPDLKAASLAIDTIAALADGVGSRLGQYDEPLRRAVDQLRQAFVQVSSQSGSGG
jgi:hypothetical protein